MLVHFQGIVVDVRSDTVFLLDDGTGIAQVSAESMSAYDSWRGQLLKGQSLQVLGTLVRDRSSDHGAIEAVKLIDVSDATELEAAFHLDVVARQRSK